MANGSHGTFTIYDIGYPRGVPDTSTPALMAAVTLEARIRNDGVETGAFIAADGSIIVQRTGAPDRVRFTVAELAGTDRTVFSRDQPSALGLGGEVTRPDLQTGEVMNVADQHKADDEALARMQAESEDLKRRGVVQFDGSSAWSDFSAALTAEAQQLAKQLEASGEVGPPELPDHLGTADT